MALKFSVSMDNSSGKRWQGYRFSGFDSLFLKLLCLNSSSSLSGTTNSFQGVDNFDVSEVPKESTAISGREVPMVTGTLF